MEGEEEGNQASTGTLDHPPAPAPSHPKHAAMLERLSNRHHHSLSRKTDPTSLDPTHSFLSLFSQSKLSIESQISLLRRQSTENQTNPDTLKSDLEKISTSISLLEKLVAENSYSLPSFEVRTCLESVSTLKQTLDALASDIVPKKRFSFKKKKDPSTVESPKTECHGSREPSYTDGGKKALSSVVNVIESESREELEGEARFRVWDSPGLKDRENEVLVRDFKGLEMGEFSLTGLTSCEVRFTGCLRALFVHKLRDCKVYVGPVFGSVLIEEVEGCVFVLASHQIRIHHARESDFYLRVRSRPIIEDCSGVRFAPYCLEYDGIERDLKESNLDEETGNWANVDDFRWLKAMQSPNWSILPESEQIGRVTIMNSDK